jgi:radical SAM superfamily enzyme YgiQ (UPF0313 family)
MLEPSASAARDAEAALSSLHALRIALISTYEMGRQPFGLGSPAAWLRERGARVACIDLSRDALDVAVIEASDLVAFYLPMHTATRLAVDVIRRVAYTRPQAHLCAFGLYAPLNAEYLRSLGVTSIIGGEFEQRLVQLAEHIATGKSVADLQQVWGSEICTERLAFRVPDRSDLPDLNRYATLEVPDRRAKTVGYTEASRGCKHFCRHCPIVPVYDGRFRIVSQEVVLTDIARQVEAGAEHITFGDPDFFNSVKHATAIVARLHQRFPELTYDVTIKIEHLLKHRDALPMLRDTGCAFVVSAVESVDDRILKLFDKGHTRSDFISIASLFRQHGLALVPTFVAFTPWTTLDGYGDLLATVADLDLVGHVAPIQLAIRLLIPSGSKLLELPDIQAFIGDFDQCALVYRWQHPDPTVDAFQSEIEGVVQRRLEAGDSRSDIFEDVWDRVREADRSSRRRLASRPQLRSRSLVPYLTEPWYC